MKNKLPQKSQGIVPMLQTFKKEVKSYYGNDLKQIILFGSYATGKFTQDSDIDLLIVLDKPTETASDDKFSELKYDFMLENDVLISCLYTTESKFSKLAEPLYYNIQREGVVI